MEADIEGYFWLKGNLGIEDTPIEEEEEFVNEFVILKYFIFSFPIKGKLHIWIQELLFHVK